MARFTTDQYEIEVATDFGPRVSHLSLRGSDNILADLPDAIISVGDSANFRLRGGHRLWVAPEIPEITYQPDDEPCVVTSSARTVRATQPATADSPIERTIEVTAAVAGIEVVHELTNRGNEPLAVAAWAITQLAPGGTAVLPLESAKADVHGFRPNRHLVAWPYTDLSVIDFINDMAIVRGPCRQPFKMGTPLTAGWIAYITDGVAFVKRTSHTPGGSYVDRGASGQVYCNDQFVELETLGQLVDLHPGQSTTHTEWWEITETAGGDVIDSLTALGLADR